VFLIRFYMAEGKVTPEIEAVAEFAVAQLGDCTGDNEQNFLVLRVNVPSLPLAFFRFTQSTI
jgi:hypothetical protein